MTIRNFALDFYIYQFTRENRREQNRRLKLSLRLQISPEINEVRNISIIAYIRLLFYVLGYQYTKGSGKAIFGENADYIWIQAMRSVNLE